MIQGVSIFDVTSSKKVEFQLNRSQSHSNTFHNGSLLMITSKDVAIHSTFSSIENCVFKEGSSLAIMHASRLQVYDISSEFGYLNFIRGSYFLEVTYFDITAIFNQTTFNRLNIQQEALFALKRGAFEFFKCKFIVYLFSC